MPGADPITAAANLGTAIAGIVDKFVPDKDQAAKLAADLQSQLLGIIGTETAGQNATNQVEAGNLNLFVAGWRPAVGWVCVLAFSWQFVGQPMLSFFWTLVTHQPAPVLALQSDALNTVLFGMLGIGGLRTWEKLKGVAS